jgi:hypothetical protein
MSMFNNVMRCMLLLHNDLHVDHSPTLGVHTHTHAHAHPYPWVLGGHGCDVIVHGWALGGHECDIIIHG